MNKNIEVLISEYDDAIKSFSINENELGIALSITAVISLIFTIFVADPLIVGGRKYFIEALLFTLFPKKMVKIDQVLIRFKG